MDLNDKDFMYISSRVKEYCGINLTDKKRPLVRNRLSRHIKTLNLSSITEYIDHIESDPGGSEFQNMIDLISTNYSTFFRESHHFDFLKNEILPNWKDRELRIWSAASSTGQEVYSILMVLEEYMRNHAVRIPYKLYASDISEKVLKQASEGIYPYNEIENIPKTLLNRYFLKGTGRLSEKVKIKNKYAEKVSFFKLNLQDSHYNLPAMDIIFLRNVMIYYDTKTKKELLQKIHDQLHCGAYLILGHSESISGLNEQFEINGKTIYRRKEK